MTSKVRITIEVDSEAFGSFNVSGGTGKTKTPTTTLGEMKLTDLVAMAFEGHKGGQNDLIASGEIVKVERSRESETALGHTLETWQSSS